MVLFLTWFGPLLRAISISTMTERFNVLALKASVGLISTQGSNPCRAVVWGFSSVGRALHLH